MAVKNALIRLIDEVRTETGYSYDQIADRATRMGFPMGGSTVAGFGQIELPMKTIKADRMRALAKGLDVPLWRVLTAALETCGLPSGPPKDWTPELAIQTDHQLSAQTKAILRAQLDAARTADRLGAPLPKVPLRAVPEPGRPRKRAARKSQDT